jgi:hypothetical protein
VREPGPSASGAAMILPFVLVGALLAAPQDTTPAPVPLAPEREQPVGVVNPGAREDTTPSGRRKAVVISDAYATRLKIHYVASYATLPLFAAQAIVGEQLFHNEQNGFPPSRSLRETHDAVAVALGALFVTNGVTGSMNWWETRHNEKGRTWRTIHAAMMLLSEAGFAYTASLGERGRFTANGGNASRDLHKTWAITSASVALAGYVMMWSPFRKD